MMPPRATRPSARVDQRPSFCDFVYSFVFQPEAFERHADRLDAATVAKAGTDLRMWQQQRLPHDELLPHVADYLNPAGQTAPTARLWKLDDALHDMYGACGRAEWTLTTPKDEIPFMLGEPGVRDFVAQLLLFRVGVGFLTLRARPLTDELDDWTTFLHYFRFPGGERETNIRAQRRIGTGSWLPFFPKPAGGIAEHSNGAGVLGDLLRALMASGSLPGSAGDWWWDLIGSSQLLPFAALFVSGVPDDEQLRLVYRLRNFFHAGRELHPASEDLRADHPSLLNYGDMQWFAHSLEGGVFIAFDPPDTPFFRNNLPRHLRDQYFLAFLLALHQRTALLHLAHDIARHWLPGHESNRYAEFERLYERLLLLQARSRFVQVTQRELTHRSYRRWRTVLQVDELYRDVGDEIRELRAHLLLQRTQRVQELAEQQQLQANRLERRLSQVALLLGVPALVIGFLGINLAGVTASDGLSLATAIALVGAGIVAAIAVLAAVSLMSRRRPSPDERTGTAGTPPQDSL
jgi:hypothetical protein